MRVGDSQACRKMDATRVRISHILELRELLRSFQTGFNFVNAAVDCAILESISGLEPSSLITEPRYLKLVTVSSFCPLALISVFDANCVVCHQFGLFGTYFYAIGCGGLSVRSTNFTTSSSSPAKPSMSSAKRRLVVVLPSMLAVPS